VLTDPKVRAVTEAMVVAQAPELGLEQALERPKLA
jgi:hypothetical protein